MFDRLRSKEVATVSAALALGLGVTACGSGGSSTSAASESNGGTSAPAASPKYPGVGNLQQDGSAVTYEEHTDATWADDGNVYYTAYCLGDLLMIQGATGINQGGGISLVARREPQTCADGTVTVAELSNIQ